MKKYYGQTLIEALITVLFIAIGVIALVRFQNYLAYDNSITQQRADATILAMSRIETLKEFQVLNTTVGYTAYQDITSGSSTVSGVNTTYTVNWVVTSYTNPTYKTIDVTVSWIDRYGNTQSIRLVSDVAGIEPSTSAAII